MKPTGITGALALSLLLIACGEGQPGASQNRQSADAYATSPVERVHSAAGTVTAVAGDQITISHGPVQGLGWPAMTMTFRVGAPEMVQDIRAGDRVAFEFIEADGGYTVMSLRKAQ